MSSGFGTLFSTVVSSKVFNTLLLCVVTFQKIGNHASVKTFLLLSYKLLK